MSACTYKKLAIPTSQQLAHYARSPQEGPRILFFSGGTALKETSHILTRYTHNSIHLITPFDSGGSSATLRKAFSMPAVGDLRNRLIALADTTSAETLKIATLLAYRFPKTLAPCSAREKLTALEQGKHPLIKKIADPEKSIIRNLISYFLHAMPTNFPLPGASVGNLVLTAKYLSGDRQLSSAIALFSQLVNTRGKVLPIVDADLHLAVELKDETTIHGQHNITGKEVPPLPYPITSIWLTHNKKPKKIAITKQIVDCILTADLICFPIGSFYSSLIATLLPQRIGNAIAQSPAPKIFIPNTGYDPEAVSLTVTEQHYLLEKYLQKSGKHITPIVHYLLIDSLHGKYPEKIDNILCNARISVLDCPLITQQSTPYLSPDPLAKLLLSLC